MEGVSETPGLFQLRRIEKYAPTMTATTVNARPEAYSAPIVCNFFLSPNDVSTTFAVIANKLHSRIVSVEDL